MLIILFWYNTLIAFNSIVLFIIGYYRYIEIKGPVEQQVVYQELKSLYAICYTPIAGVEEDKQTSSTSPYLIKFYGIHF